MGLPPDQFIRIAGRVDLSRLANERVVVIGVGTVGSMMAHWLADCGLGSLLLVDGDTLDEHNLPRHALPRAYLHWNKAEAMAVFLSDNVSTLRSEALGRYVDDDLADRQLDTLLMNADVVIAATDRRHVQWRIARRSLSLDIPAIFPLLYSQRDGGGGEVFVQRSSADACFFCWDGWRPDRELAAERATRVEAIPTIALAVELALGLLDPRSPFVRRLSRAPGEERRRQIFIQRPDAELSFGPADRQRGCPSCAVGPPGSRQTASDLADLGWSSEPRVPAGGPANALLKLVVLAAGLAVVALPLGIMKFSGAMDNDSLRGGGWIELACAALITVCLIAFLGALGVALDDAPILGQARVRLGQQWRSTHVANYWRAYAVLGVLLGILALLILGVRSFYENHFTFRSDIGHAAGLTDCTGNNANCQVTGTHVSAHFDFYDDARAALHEFRDINYGPGSFCRPQDSSQHPLLVRGSVNHVVSVSCDGQSIQYWPHGTATLVTLTYHTPVSNTFFRNVPPPEPATLIHAIQKLGWPAGVR